MRVVLERSSSPGRKSSDSVKSNCLAWAEAARPLGDLLLLDGDDVDWDAVEAHALQQVLGLLVHIEHAALGVLGEVESRHLWDVLVLPLTLLLLQLAGDDRNLIADTLVGLEVQSEARVVALDQHLGRLLYGFRPDATHLVWLLQRARCGGRKGGELGGVPH